MRMFARALVGAILAVGSQASGMAFACFIAAGALLAGIVVVDGLRKELEQMVIETDLLRAVNDQHKKK